MLIGAESALFTIGITMGSLSPGTAATTSHINASPWDAVAHIALAPAADAPTVQDIAECSDSTGIISVSTMPFATKDANCSTIGV